MKITCTVGDLAVNKPSSCTSTRYLVSYTQLRNLGTHKPSDYSPKFLLQRTRCPAHLRSDHEWSFPSRCPGVHYCPVMDQHVDQRHAAALGSTVQGGVAKPELHRLCMCKYVKEVLPYLIHKIEKEGDWKRSCLPVWTVETLCVMIVTWFHAMDKLYCSHNRLQYNPLNCFGILLNTSRALTSHDFIGYSFLYSIYLLGDSGWVA